VGLVSNGGHVVAGIDLPNPIDIVTDVVAAPVGWAFDKVAEGIAKWVLGAVGFFVDGVINFLLTSARPDVEAAWFSGSNSPYATVRGMAVVLLLAFLFLGIIQGVLAGDVGAMLRRIGADLPAAVFGMVTTTIVVGKLLELTDALSARVLANSDGQAVHFLSGFGLVVTGASQGFAAVLVGLIAVVAGLLIWVELMVRSVLVYILVALSPLSFAAMVWPAARGVLRRTVELLIAVIVSKLVICIAIAVGVAALSGAGNAAQPGAGVGDQAAASMGTLIVGTAILAMAAFAPFLVLKLIPWAEAALVAQGMSRSPIRASHSAMSTVYYADSLGRLAGGGAAASGQARPWTVGAPTPGNAALGASAGSAAAAGPAAVATAAGTTVARQVGAAATGTVEATTAIPSSPTTSPRPPSRRPPVQARRAGDERRDDDDGGDA
jgi:hypothetical protein